MNEPHPEIAARGDAARAARRRPRIGAGAEDRLRQHRAGPARGGAGQGGAGQARGRVLASARRTSPTSRNRLQDRQRQARQGRADAGRGRAPRRQRELVDQDRELQRKRREFQEDLNQRRNEELATVVERANRVIKQIFETEKYDLILQEAVFCEPARSTSPTR